MTITPDRRAYSGSSVPKLDGDRFVRGKVRFTDDIVLRGMTYAASVVAATPHARIAAVDKSDALASPGVLAVVTGADLAGLVGPIQGELMRVGKLETVELRCLPIDHVVHAGQSVAVVVAETRADAVTAAARVEIEYDPLPFVVDAEIATSDGAPLVYENWGTNIAFSAVIGDNRFDEAARAAAHVVEDELRVSRSAAAPMETRAYVADWDETIDQLTWYGTHNAPHLLRQNFAATFDLSEAQVRVVTPAIGGSFGYKSGHPEEYLACALTRLVKRPVKWVEERSQALLYGAKEQRFRYRAAFGDDGRVVAVHCHVLSNHGAASTLGAWGMPRVGGMSLASGYDIASVTAEVDVVATNKTPFTAVRPYCKETGALVMESVMERVSERTGLDPAEVRRRNWVQREAFPHPTGTGFVLDSGDYRGLLDKVLARLDYSGARADQERLRADGRLIGIGFGFEVLPEGVDVPGALGGGAFDTTCVRMSPSGQVTVLTGVTSPGNGNDTAIAQVVADRLGVRLGSVQVVQGDTAVCPFGFGNMSSRGTVTGGGSAALAADEVAATLRRVAALLLECALADVVLSDGCASCADDPGRSLSITELAAAVFTRSDRLTPDLEPRLEATRTFKMDNVRGAPDEQGRRNNFSTYSNALYVSIVEVDRETGVVSLLRHVMAHDCGTMVNPRFVRGQFTGGVVAGVGAALGERIVHGSDGLPTSSTFKTYLLPRANEIPPFELDHQETPSPYTPLGTKGAGESGVACAMASILNAVNDALRPEGVVVRTLPLTPDVVLAALTVRS